MSEKFSQTVGRFTIEEESVGAASAAGGVRKPKAGGRMGAAKTGKK